MNVNIFFLVAVVVGSLAITTCTANRLTKHFPADPQKVIVVGLFGENEEQEKLAFEEAIEDVNKDASILKRTLLVNQTKIVDLHNAFVIKKTLCSEMEKGITVVFGPNSEEGIDIVQSITNAFRIPYIFSKMEASLHSDDYSVNIFPSIQHLTKGIQEIIHDMDWTAFTLLYEKDEDLSLFQDLLIEHEQLKNEENFQPILLRQLPEDKDYGPLLKELKKRGESRFVVHCDKENIVPLLRKAKNLELMGDYFAYVIISMDAHQIMFREFAATKTNITILSMIDPITYLVDSQDSNYDRFSTFVHQNVRRLKTLAFLIYDAVYLFAKALDTFLENETLEVEELDCRNNGTFFTDGLALMNIIKTTEIKMVTGLTKINEKGERSFHAIQIMQMIPREYYKLGSWNPEKRIDYSRNKTQMIQESEDILVNKTFIVSSILGEPYLMKCPKELEDESAKENEGEEASKCYTGFSRDLIDAIARERKFKYKIVIPADGKRGSLDLSTNKWDGIIKEVQDRRADLGICDLTITHERRKAVDFTKPFMNLGISILYKKNIEEETGMFSFLNPFRFEVWLCVATSLLALSIALFFVSRLTPYDWDSPHPCDSDVEELENALSLVNSLWFSLGSVLQQGCDILPQAVSSRIVAAMWWFFTLIMVSTYTANLAAFLTTQQMDSEIKDVEQLASQSAIKYGCNRDGSTATFFKTSNDNLYQKIWATMESNPAVFTTNNDEGKNRVLREKRYAFFMESSTIEYMVERNCELTQVGGLLDNKGYGIAMPLNSPYRTSITTALLQLQESGKVRELKEKYWTVTGEKKCVRVKKDEIEENALAVDQVGGVFVVLVVGMAFSFILSILEFLWNIRKVAVIEKISLEEAFRKELNFVLNCHISTKPVRKPSEKISENNDHLDRYKEFIAISDSQNLLKR